MRSCNGTTAPVTPLSFVQKWSKTSLNERQTSQEHFLDFCAMFDHPTPGQADSLGQHFAFEEAAAIRPAKRKIEGKTPEDLRAQPELLLPIVGGQAEQAFVDETIVEDAEDRKIKRKAKTAGLRYSA